MSEAQPKRTRGSSLPSEMTGGRPGPWSVLFKVASAALSGALIVLLLGAIIPKVGDFQGVGESLKSMDPWVVLLFFAIAVAIRLLLAQAYLYLTPPVNFRKSLIAREASSAVSNVIPGPSGTASQFVILHSWGVTAERYARATFAVGTATNVLIFAAPGFLFIGWVLLGRPGEPTTDNSMTFALFALGVSALALVVVGAIAKSERLARLVGRICQASINPFRRLLGKPRITTWPDKTVDVRNETLDELRNTGWGFGSCIFGGYALNGILLVGCIWACGVSREAMPLSLGFMLYSVGRLATVVNITPGGIGVVEIAYTAVYVAVLGESSHDAVVAGVLVYRAFTYLLPIIDGAFAYIAWRLMRRHERHEEQAPPAAEPAQ